MQHDDPLPNGYSVVINGHYNTKYNLQDASPLRPKSLNYVNTPSIFTTLNNLFSPLMKEKMRQRVRILPHIYTKHSLHCYCLPRTQLLRLRMPRHVSSGLLT